MKDECYICGKPALTEALVEGARVFLCGNCQGFGTPIATSRPVPTKLYSKSGASVNYPSPNSSQNPHTSQNLHSSQNPQYSRHEIAPVPNYGKTLQSAREQIHMTRKELGEKLFISENVIERIEHEYLKPDLKTAQKLEQFLKIKIIQEDVPEKVDDGKKELAEMRKQNKGSGNLTAGDVIEIKTRKK